MTDDFQLFADPDDGDSPIDPDVALVSAYLARELSPMQVLALEERLATDAGFRASMQPLIDLWAAPVASLEGGAAHHIPPLSGRERTESWQRFLEEQSQVGSEGQHTHRRVSMKRIAAVIGLAVLPMVSFAQVVVHAANNADAPGHTIARRIVAPFVDEAQTPKPRAEPRRPKPRTEAARPAPEANVPTPAAAPLPVVIDVLSALSPAQRPEPDRARIAELARQHQPAAVRGDSTLEYVVMVLDAADRYLWSTAGSGNFSIEVGGDSRTPQERSAYNREHRAEFRGAAGGGGRGGSEVRVISPSAATDTLSREFVLVPGIIARRLGRPDSSFVLRIDTAVLARQPGGRGRGAGVGASDSLAANVRLRMVEFGQSSRVAGGGRGGSRGVASDSAGASAPPTTYRSGWSTQSPLLNEAAGLNEPADGQSGITGLASASVASADMYVYPAGELAPRLLRIMVVHLVPGATWTGRF